MEDTFIIDKVEAMSIRLGNIDDVPKIQPLLEELGYPTDLNKLKERCTKFLNTDGYGIAVYEVDGGILGFIAWSKSMLLVGDLPRYNIEALIVNNDHRGKGIGKQLMQFLEALCDQCVIDITSSRKRKSAHKFYKSLGYLSEKVFFRKTKV